jgi:ATP-binding cassette, subfamily C, bacteriocin exporter
MKAPVKNFTLQQDQSDCGVACLLSIIQFHGGSGSLEELRKLSGTSRQGTTLLGLLQAAQQSGFDAEGLEAEGVHNLSELNEPAILHVVMENRLQHYLVYYDLIPVPSPKEKGGVNKGSRLDKSLSSGEGFRVRLLDPAKGIIHLTSSELDKIWQSKALLKLTPNASFQKSEAQKGKKKQWIVELIKDDFPILLIALFLGLAISVLGISTALFSQKLIDDILPKENTQKLWLSLVLVALLLFARSGLGYLRGLLIVHQGMDFNNRIIQKFYNNLLQLPKSFFDTRKIGELIARMNDTRRIQTVLSVVSGSIVIDLLLVLTSLVFLFTYSAVVGFIMLGCLPVYFLILYSFNKPIIHSQKEVMAGYALAESNFVDTMQGVADIKLMNKQPFFEKLNATIYGDFQNRIVSLGKLNSKFGLVSDLVGVAFMIAVFGVASWLVLTKKLTVGELVALLGMASNIIPSANRLVVSNIQIQEALVAFDRMFEFTAMERENLIPCLWLGRPSTSSQERGAVSDKNDFPAENLEVTLQNISFRFPGRKQILKNVSLQIKKGEMVALLGESGGGKSTLMQIIQKFYNPEDGSIEVNGLNLQSIDTIAWRNCIGCVPQEVKIFNGNLLYNITLSDQPEDYQRAIQFCEEKGFVKFFNEFPQGYLTLLGEEGINISGGQKQLVALARALFRKPQLLLLDEATAAMDKHTEAFILSILEQERKSMAILMVTHRTKTAEVCDRIYELEKGEMVVRLNLENV